MALPVFSSASSSSANSSKLSRANWVEEIRACLASSRRSGVTSLDVSIESIVYFTTCVLYKTNYNSWSPVSPCRILQARLSRAVWRNWSRVIHAAISSSARRVFGLMLTRVPCIPISRRRRLMVCSSLVFPRSDSASSSRRASSLGLRINVHRRPICFDPNTWSSVIILENRNRTRALDVGRKVSLATNLYHKCGETTGRAWQPVALHVGTVPIDFALTCR